MPHYVLIQARTSDEPVGPEEHASFAQHLGVPLSHVETVSALTDPLDADQLLDRADAILVGGSGKFGVNDPTDWLPRFFDLLGEVADRDFPTFASCFGFQGLCIALGAPVRKDTEAAEVGTYRLWRTEAAAHDPVFSSLPAEFNAQLGHKDRATRLPEQAIWLARSERCEFQAMRLGENVYATQFHPEFGATANKRRFLQYWDEYSVVFGEVIARQILEAFEESAEASALLGRFAQRIG